MEFLHPVPELNIHLYIRSYEISFHHFRIV